jgi:hypothetical protein
MTRTDQVLQCIETQHARWLTNSDIRSFTRIRLHQQVFQITQLLLSAGRIRGEMRGREWYFSALPAA